MQTIVISDEISNNVNYVYTEIQSAKSVAITNVEWRKNTPHKMLRIGRVKHI